MNSTTYYDGFDFFETTQKSSHIMKSKDNHIEKHPRQNLQNQRKSIYANNNHYETHYATVKGQPLYILNIEFNVSFGDYFSDKKLALTAYFFF